MNLLGAALYDPAAAVSKSTSAALVMTAFDTTNLRVTVTVPAHGFMFFRLMGVIEGATTYPQVMMGVMNGAAVVGRVVPQGSIEGTALATTRMPVMAEFTATGLSAGSTNFDAAYGVETGVASTNFKYGGPNDTTSDNAWGGFVFEVWDPRPLPTAASGAVNGLLTAPTTANVGTVDIVRWNGTVVSSPATAGIPDVNVKNMNNVAATSITTINANQGTTQPVNFTGTAGIALVKSDMTDIAGAAVSTTSVQIGVNVINIAGSASAGAAGYVGVDWGHVTASTTTVSLSNTTIGTLTTYTGNTPQTGDAFARIGAAGVSLTNVGLTTSQAFNNTGTWTGNVVGTLSTCSLVTVVTNVTNAPTAGDFTAAMKTSLNAATPASVTGAVGSVTGAVGSVTGAVTVGTNNDKTGYALTVGANNLVADALLARNISGGSSAGRTVAEALYPLRNLWTVNTSSGVYSVYLPDDTTVAWTASLTTNASAAPITGSDPT